MGTSAYTPERTESNRQERFWRHFALRQRARSAEWGTNPLPSLGQRVH